MILVIKIIPSGSIKTSEALSHMTPHFLTLPSALTESHSIWTVVKFHLNYEKISQVPCDTTDFPHSEIAMPVTSYFVKDVPEPSQVCFKSRKLIS